MMRRREAQLSPEARLAYHQAYSRPIMDGLKGWLKKQFDDRLVEPNSSLGKAISYMQGHWETLTRFLEVPGAPLDNNLVERTLKLFIRQRKNSLFFATEHSAYIGSVLTSLIATCLHARGQCRRLPGGVARAPPRGGRRPWGLVAVDVPGDALAASVEPSPVVSHLRLKGEPIPEQQRTG